MDSLTAFLKHIHRIKIEVTNVCNAKCIFCAYRIMTRRKALISDTLYQSAINQISEIGCEVLMLSPVVGDPLLHKSFPWHLQRASDLPGIGRIHFFTNLIGMATFNDEELYSILNDTDTIIVSIAPNKKMYAELFGVDQFENIVTSLNRVASVCCTLKNKPFFVFEGRAKNGFEIDSRLQDVMNVFEGNSRLNWITKYSDWGGTIHAEDISLQTGDRSRICTVPCERALVPVVYTDGKVGLCACADYDQKMLIGDLNEERLDTILVSQKRRKYLELFKQGKVPPFCAKCTFYVPHPKAFDTWASLLNDDEQNKGGCLQNSKLSFLARS